MVLAGACSMPRAGGLSSHADISQSTILLYKSVSILPLSGMSNKPLTCKTPKHCLYLYRGLALPELLSPFTGFGRKDLMRGTTYAVLSRMASILCGRARVESADYETLSAEKKFSRFFCQKEVT